MNKLGNCLTMVHSIGGMHPTARSALLQDEVAALARMREANTSARGRELNARISARGNVLSDKSVYNVSTSGMTAAEKQVVIEYAKLTNAWLKGNGGTTVQSTAGTLRSQANAAARNERLTAARSGRPYQGQAGHVPDTALTGTAKPPAGWLDMPGKSNSVIGGGLSSRIGKRVDVLTVDGKVP